MSELFRLATLADAEEIHALQSATDAEVNAFLGWPAREIKLDYFKRRLRNQAKGIGNKRMYVLLRDGAIIAMASVSESPPAFWGRNSFLVPSAKSLCVFDVAVLPAWQRRGIGTQIMRAIESVVQSRGLRFVRLDAYAENPRSINFYRRLGYQERRRCEVRGCKLACFEKDLSDLN